MASENLNDESLPALPNMVDRIAKFEIEIDLPWENQTQENQKIWEKNKRSLMGQIDKKLTSFISDAAGDETKENYNIELCDVSILDPTIGRWKATGPVAKLIEKIPKWVKDTKFDGYFDFLDRKSDKQTDQSLVFPVEIVYQQKIGSNQGFPDKLYHDIKKQIDHYKLEIDMTKDRAAMNFQYTITSFTGSFVESLTRKSSKEVLDPLMEDAEAKPVEKTMHRIKEFKKGPDDKFEILDAKQCRFLLILYC